MSELTGNNSTNERLEKVLIEFIETTLKNPTQGDCLAIVPELVKELIQLTNPTF